MFLPPLVGSFSMSSGNESNTQETTSSTQRSRKIQSPFASSCNIVEAIMCLAHDNHILTTIYNHSRHYCIINCKLLVALLLVRSFAAEGAPPTPDKAAEKREAKDEKQVLHPIN